MRRETLITALVFFVLGSIAGYVFRAQTSSANGVLADAGVTGNSGTDTGNANAEPSGSGGQLPPGHPAISDPAVVQTLQQQAAQDPQDPAPSLQLANYFYDHGDYPHAIVWYRKVTEIDPRNVNASTDLGTCYFNLGRFDEALQQLRHSLTIEPQHQPTLYNLVVVNLEGKRDYKAAEQAWQMLHRLNPRYPNLDQLKQKLDQAMN